MLRHICDALAISFFIHFCQVCPPLPVFVILKCVWDISGCGTVFCVGRGGL
uniref:Uncharacterized protein n=1 Tax=Anguilla anguilla TaxID=7936 RepID=A0A0E9RI05_ANGAN